MKKNYAKHYTEENLWDKIQGTAKTAGREMIEKAMILYYVANDPKTPVWAKGVIAAALGYFIFPLDAIPDITPVVGYGDDIGVVLAALTALGTSVTRRHIASARAKTVEWFGKKNLEDKK